MAVFTVHEPPEPAGDRLDRAEELVFVKDGFSWAAALIAPVWLIYRGEWLLLVIYLVIAIALAGLLTLLGVPAEWVSIAGLAFNVLFAFEAGELSRWLLELRGWHEIAAVSGRRLDDAERRFFDAWLAGERLATPHPYGRAEVRPLTGGWLGSPAQSWLQRMRDRLGVLA